MGAFGINSFDVFCRALICLHAWLASALRAYFTGVCCMRQPIGAQPGVLALHVLCVCTAQASALLKLCPHAGRSLLQRLQAKWLT